MPYTVTRQRQWPDGTPVVEISRGGLDYTNPDALTAKYQGEFSTFEDPREAVETAIKVCQAWRQDGERRAKIGHGATGGFTAPFDTCTFQAAREWAQQAYDRLPKCPRCGGLLGETTYYICDLLDDERFCSEFCAEAAAGDQCQNT